MKISKKLLLAFAALVVSVPSFSEGLKTFKLKNGLSVIIWEDNTQPDVYGAVAVRAGSINDPEQYTGLAHYLEHLMFKGTQTIGALNWTEEEPIYNQIIAKYDEMANETDPAKKKAISDEINELTVAAGKISVSNEFSNLNESMGGKGLNAGTGYDMTYYHNYFPAFQINKWLELSSQRFLKPVFRTFQTELETVYEEYNMYKDMPSEVQSEFIREKAFEGHPYSRSIAGLGEHLKNPRLSELIKFYNDWYVAENMALILVGNVNTEQIQRRIAATFGRLPQGKTPERKQYPNLEITGRKQYSAKIGDYPSVVMIYPGVPSGHPDENALKIALSLLSNGSSTGALDKLSIDGEITAGYAGLSSLREQGRCMIQAIPLYDQNQRRYESNKSVEKKALKVIEQIANGDFEPWIVDAIKANLCRSYDISQESNQGMLYKLMSAFINEQDFSTVLEYKEEIANISVEDIKRVAKQYLGKDYMVINIEAGKSNKGEKIEKPGYDPIEPPVGQQSLYAQQFKTLPIGSVEENFMDFNEVKSQPINEKSKFFYTQNTVNPVFSLTVRYGVGTEKYPNLGIAASLMNNAGIMGAYEPQELKKELSKLNISCNVFADDDYLTVYMTGYENNLADACQLLARQILMPKLDEKQMKRLQGSALGARAQRKNNPETLGGALEQYIRYGSESGYLKELTDKEIFELGISTLTGDINRASNYEAEIFYTGALPYETAYEILSNNLPLVANEKTSESPFIKPYADVQENTIYFLPNSDTEQAQIFVFMPTTNYDKKDNVVRSAFNQYFSGGFNGLILHELREKRSMVYGADARVITPELPNYPTAFVGSLSTQNDKAVEAVGVFMDLVRNMPENPDRIDNIKNYMKQTLLSTKPSFRYKAQQFESQKRRGYTQDPAIENIPLIENLAFDDIVKFYEENVKDKPMVIGIMGNPKNISQDDLKKFGKVVRLTDKKLFNTKDSFF